MSDQLTRRLHEVADAITVTEENIQVWVQSAAAEPKQKTARGKTAILLAAVVGSALLLGFGYRIASRYFDQVINVDPMLIPYSEEWELPEDAVAALLREMQPGDVRTLVDFAEGLFQVHVFKGDTVDYAVYVKNGGKTVSTQVIEHNPKPREGLSPQEVDIQDFIDRGIFIAGLEGEGYAQQTVTSSSDGDIPYMVGYTGPEGEKLTISLYSIAVAGDDDGMTSYDIQVNDRSFMYLETEERDEEASREMILYLGEDNLSPSVTIHGVEATKEQLVEAARHLVLYNQEANTSQAHLVFRYDADYFTSIPEPVISADAEKIAKACVELPPSDRGGYATAWEKDGWSVEAHNREDGSVNIRFHNQGGTLSDVASGLGYPMSIPFDGEDWFRPGEFTRYTMFADSGGLGLFSAYLGDEQMLNIRPLTENRAPIHTPLDAIGSEIRNAGDTLVRVIEVEKGMPLLIGLEERGMDDQTIVVTGAQEVDGQYFLYTLRIPENQLTEEIRSQLLGTN